VVRTWVFFHALRPAGIEDAGLIYLERVYYPTWTRMDGLLAGVTLALIRIHRPRWWQAVCRHPHATLAAGLALFGVSLWLFNDRFTSQTGPAAWGTFVGFPLVSLALGLIVASSISPRGLLHRVRIPGTTWLASLAYSLYLSHKGLAHLVDTRWPTLADEHSVKSFLVYAAAILGGAALLHYAVERPFLYLRDRNRSRAPEAELGMDPGI
jgi:peptidoglycan/LPS O-acetylase OafA/YrhL